MKCPDDYAVVMVNLPGDILAAVRINQDGYPTIYINDCLSLAARREALRHELRHLKNGDFHNHLTIYDAEKQASGESRISAMPRSFRPLTDDDHLRLLLLGHQLQVATFGATPCTDPLPMPSPLFDTPPQSFANRPKEVW